MCELKAGGRVIIGGDGKCLESEIALKMSELAGKYAGELEFLKLENEELKKRLQKDDSKRCASILRDSGFWARCTEFWPCYEGDGVKFPEEKEEKKYTQAEMDEANLRIKFLENDNKLIKMHRDSLLEDSDKDEFICRLKKAVINKEADLWLAKEKIEELKAQCKSLKKEKNIADVNIATLEGQKRLLEYELFDLREGK